MDLHKLSRFIHINDIIFTANCEEMFSDWNTWTLSYSLPTHYLARLPVSHESLQAGSVQIQGVKIQAPQGFISFSATSWSFIWRIMRFCAELFTGYSVMWCYVLWCDNWGTVVRSLQIFDSSAKSFRFSQISPAPQTLEHYYVTVCLSWIVAH